MNDADHYKNKITKYNVLLKCTIVQYNNNNLI